MLTLDGAGAWGFCNGDSSRMMHTDTDISVFLPILYDCSDIIFKIGDIPNHPYPPKRYRYRFSEFPSYRYRFIYIFFSYRYQYRVSVYRLILGIGRTLITELYLLIRTNQYFSKLTGCITKHRKIQKKDFPFFSWNTSANLGQWVTEPRFLNTPVVM